MAAASDQESEKELKRIEPEKVEILEPKEPECVTAPSDESGEKIEKKKIEPHVAEEVKEIKTDVEPKAAEQETAAAASTESGVKIEEEKTVPPVAEEAEKIRTYEKPKADDAAEPTTQNVDDKQVESPVIKEETKTEDSPITQGTKETVLESGTTNNSEPSTECKSEDKTGAGSAAEKEESRSESVEEKIVELPSKVEELPAAEVETIVPDDVKVSKISESTPLVEEKPVEQPEIIELTGKEPIVVLEKTVETRAEKIEPRKSEVETTEKSVVADKSSAESEGDTEKTAESKAISRDIELAPENEKKEETIASGETNTAAEVDDKAEKEATITEKEAKKTPVTETKLEEEKKDDEAVKADAQDSECTKDSEETKTSQDVPKEDEKELKRIEPEKVEILEPKEPECVAALSDESGEKIEEKKIEPHVAEEVKEIKTDVEPKAAEPETVAAASTESGVKIEEKKTEPHVAEETEEIRTYEKPKAEDAAEPTAQNVDYKKLKSPVIKEETKTEDSPITQGTKEIVLESGTTNNSEPSTECKSEDKTGTGSAAEKEESRPESVEEKIEEPPSRVEELPAAEVETIVPDDVKVSKISESTPLVEEKPLEQPEVTALTVKEPTGVDPIKDVEVETGIDKVEDSMLPIEVEAAKEETIVEVSNQVDSETPEIKVLVKDVEYFPSGEVLEKTVETRAEKIEPTKSEVETAEKSAVADKSSAECEGDTEKRAESEAISRDIELAPENEKKEETVASAETNTATEVEDKAKREATITEREAKEEEKTPVPETKLEEDKKDDEAVKADAQHSECTKDSQETKTSQDVPKEDVPVKKQSNNIIKMVKHSLGKAKKAIIGKSQNSKAPAASKTKDELSK